MSLLTNEIKNQVKRPLFWVSIILMYLFCYCIWNLMYLACIGIHGIEACNG